MPRIALICSIFILSSAVAVAQPAPTTAPPTQSTTELAPNSPVRTWFADLASPDAGVRDRAQTQLMGISRDDLLGLRLLIQQTRPLAASQAAALHDIVIQVFLAGETYDTIPEQSFLGVRLAPGVEDFGATPGRIGVPIDQRFPGFPAYQMLRDGDMILAVVKDPAVPMQQLPNLQTLTSRILHDAIAGSSALRPIELMVLRQGQPVRVALKLAPLPKELALAHEERGTQAFLMPRIQRAEQFWQEQFAPLLKPDVS